MTILYKAADLGLTEIGGLSSWTSSVGHARLYTTSRFAGFGGQCLYSVKADGRALDLRVDLAVRLFDEGVDLDDYPDEPLHDILRALAPLLRSRGYDWVAFCEHPTDASADEWLHVGLDALSVRRE